MKYIVYLTENIQNNKIYVGVHKTENPDIFDGYYGNGINIKDQSKLKHPKEPFHYALKKYGFKNFRRNTIKVFDTLEEALELEKQIVDQDFINRKDTYNITLGGGMPLIKQVIVYQFSLDGTLLNSYESIKSASKIINIDDFAIGYAIKNKTTSGGYLWATTKLLIQKTILHLYREKKYIYILKKENLPMNLNLYQNVVDFQGCLSDQYNVHTIKNGKQVISILVIRSLITINQKKYSVMVIIISIVWTDLILELLHLEKN